MDDLDALMENSGPTGRKPASTSGKPWDRIADSKIKNNSVLDDLDDFDDFGNDFPLPLAKKRTMAAGGSQAPPAKVTKTISK